MVNMFLAKIKREPVLYSPVDCNQPPANEGHEAMAAMSVPMTLAVVAMVSLLAMGLMEGLVYYWLYSSGSHCSFMVSTVSSHYPTTASEPYEVRCGRCGFLRMESG